MKPTQLPNLNFIQRRNKLIIKAWVNGFLAIVALLGIYGIVDLNERRVEAELHAQAASRNAATIGLMWRECVDKK